MKIGISEAGMRRLSMFSKLAIDIPEELLTMSIEEFKQSPVPGYKINQRGSEDANATDPNHIELSPGFFNYPESSRKHILMHENAHRVFDQLSSQGSDFWLKLFELVDQGAFGPKDEETGELTQGINGQFTPMENLVEGITVYQEEPEWLEANYPLAYDFISSLNIL